MAIEENLAERDKTIPPAFVRSKWVGVVLIVVSIGMFLWSASYEGAPRALPMLVAASLAVLAVIDLLCRFDSPRLQLLRDFWGADFTKVEMQHNPPVLAELIQILWVSACVLAMLMIGFLPAVPIFIALYMFFQGRRPLLESVIVAAMVFAFVYLVFELLLQYDLYRGALFDPRGIAGW